MLTRKQHHLLCFIQDQMRDGVTPSFTEMQRAMGMRSKSGIHRLITNLEQRGFVRRLPNRARAIEIIRFPAQKYGSASVRVMGSIAENTLVSDLTQVTREILMPAEMLDGDEHFALNVETDAMNGAGIIAGDIALLHRAAKPMTGEIVVAAIGTQAILRRFHRRNDLVALEPSNDLYMVKFLQTATVSILGKLVGLYRSY
jgi:repressor LexA